MSWTWRRLLTIAPAGCAVACTGDRGDASWFAEGTAGEGAAGGATDVVPTGGQDGSASEPSGGDATAAEGSDEPGVNFDTPDGNSGGADDGGRECGCAGKDFSYVFVANSNDSTVSKVDTHTMQELGRYRTHPGAGNPSRTSVSLAGTAVAVANRNGGIVKITANVEDCKGPNTSSGPNDVLPWGEDDCVEWFTAFDHASQRPVAFDPGKVDPDTCERYDERIWTAGCSNSGPVSVHRLDSATGTMVETAQVAGFDCDSGKGPYGGAVDYAGNFWFVSQMGQLARVDAVTFAYELYAVPGLNPFAGLAAYGITVDSEARPWISLTAAPGAIRFDPDAQAWDTAVGQDFSSPGGLQESDDDIMWISAYAGGASGVMRIDSNTMSVLGFVDLGIAAPPYGYVKGVSVDRDGFVWAVDLMDGRLMKIDPVAFTFDTVGGFNVPYTYSDMTGGGVKNAACNPPEG